MRVVSGIALLVLFAACTRERAAMPGRAGDTNEVAGQVVYGTVNVEQGNVSTNVLNDRLAQIHPALEGCYKDASIKTGKTEGSMDLRLRGERSGMTVEVTKNTVNDASLTQCVVEAVKHVNVGSDSSTAPGFMATWSVNFKPNG